MVGTIASYKCDDDDLSSVLTLAPMHRASFVNFLVIEQNIYLFHGDPLANAQQLLVHLNDMAF